MAVVSSPARRLRLGALAPDTSRSIVVVSASGELAVALRERVDQSMAVIRDVRPGEAEAAVRACAPFPWLVAGEGDVPDAVLSAQRFPTLTLWRDDGASVPAGARPFATFAELCTAIDAALRNQVGGLHLAIGRGVALPNGSCVASAYLESLVSAYPAGVSLPNHVRRALAALLARHAPSIQVIRNGGGRCALRPVAA